MTAQLEPGWLAVLDSAFDQEYMQGLRAFLLEEKAGGHRVFPPGNLIFNAFNSTPFNQVKVVILGQDPYHGAGQAHGLSFSVQDGQRLPPSLKNIYKELESDLAMPAPVSGDLSGWARQGVFLLNASLTVREAMAGSHQKQGWEQFTDQVIRKLSAGREHLVFILWGAHARSKKVLIDTRKHLILESAHPSPLSAYNGFFGSRPFSKTNDWLRSENIIPINWLADAGVQPEQL